MTYPDLRAILAWNDAGERLATALEAHPLAEEWRQSQIGVFSLRTRESRLLNAAANAVAPCRS